jgi:hypothetical protein
MLFKALKVRSDLATANQEIRRESEKINIHINHSFFYKLFRFMESRN